MKNLVQSDPPEHCRSFEALIVPQTPDLEAIGEVNAEN